ncbi:MAG: hypothetical protein ACK5ME_02000 [Parahaliea sp.]
MSDCNAAVFCLYSLRSNLSVRIGLIFLCLLLISLPLQAAVGGVYGERLLRVGADDVLQTPPALQTDMHAASTTTDGIAWQQALDTALREGGPYSDAAVEPLQGLARWQRAQDDLAAAQENYSRALHVVRINDGLRSPRQLPLLRELIALARQLGNTELLNNRYEYLYYLYGSGKPPYDEQQLVIMAEYINWQREALMLNLGDAGAWRSRLLGLLELNDEILNTLLTTDNVDSDRWRWQLIQSQLKNLHILLAGLKPLPDKLDTLSGKHAYSYSSSFHGDAIDVERRRLDDLRRHSVAYGHNLLVPYAAVEHCHLRCMQARLRLADWYQWNGHLRKAAGLYTTLASDLKRLGDEQHLNEWFAEPVELPANGEFLLPASLERNGPVMLQIQFNVSATGRVSHIDTGDVADEFASAAVRAGSELAGIRFRPALNASGEPLAVKKLVRHYQWLPLRRH